MVEFVMTPESLRKPSSSKKTVPVKGKLKPPGPPEVSTPPKTSSKPPSSEQLQNNIKKPDLGLKRKAENVLPTVFDGPISQMSSNASASSKISNRRESGQQPKRTKLPESLRFCNEILRELFNKRHSAYAWPFYKPVDAET